MSVDWYTQDPGAAASFARSLDPSLLLTSMHPLDHWQSFYGNSSSSPGEPVHECVSHGESRDMYSSSADFFRYQSPDGVVPPPRRVMRWVVFSGVSPCTSAFCSPSRHHDPSEKARLALIIHLQSSKHTSLVSIPPERSAPSAPGDLLGVPVRLCLPRPHLLLSRFQVQPWTHTAPALTLFPIWPRDANTTMLRRTVRQVGLPQPTQRPRHQIDSSWSLLQFCH